MWGGVFLLLNYLALGPRGGSGSTSCGGGNSWRTAGTTLSIGGDLCWGLL